MSLFTTLIAASGIGGTPDPNGLPGSPALQSLISGLAFWALLASLGGLLISAAVWALSSHSGNYHHSALGRQPAEFLIGMSASFPHRLADDGRVTRDAADFVDDGALDLGRGQSLGRACRTAALHSVGAAVIAVPASAARRKRV